MITAKNQTITFKNILVPVDFSETSDKAVEHALFLAENYTAHLTLLHVVTFYEEMKEEKKNIEEYEKFVEEKEAEGFRKLQKHSEDAGERGVEIDSQLRKGVFASDSIIDFIDTQKYDMVIIGTHGRTGFKKFLFGSVAEKVVRHSSIPVLTTQHSLKKFAIERILVPVDFSKYSKEAVRYAGEIAKKFEAQIEFLHVIRDEIHPAYYGGGVESMFVIDKNLRSRSTEELKKFAGYEEDNCKYTILEGEPFNAIVEHAEKTGTDLIIMGTRGHTGLDYFLVGSTAERVVRLAPCPTLTVGRDL